MNRIRAFLPAAAPDAVDWAAVRHAGERASRARTPGDIFLALKAIFPGWSPWSPLPAHLKAGNGPEAALAVLVDGLRDALNAALEDEDGDRDAVYRLVTPDDSHPALDADSLAAIASWEEGESLYDAAVRHFQIGDDASCVSAVDDALAHEPSDDLRGRLKSLLARVADRLARKAEPEGE
jgi:hypothetical protein